VIDANGSPQTVLLLGGTSEIALATAAAYAATRPPRVVLAAREGPRRVAAVEQLRSLGCMVDVVDFDARDTAAHPAAIAACFAAGDVDVCLVAFGILGDQEQAWTDVDAAVALAQTNYVGAVSVGVLLAQRMSAQGHGSIVALSTVAAERPRRANFVYGSTKAGLDAFYSGLTEALRPAGVHVSVIRPGFVHSRMTRGLTGPVGHHPRRGGSRRRRVSARSAGAGLGPRGAAPGDERPSPPAPLGVSPPARLSFGGQPALQVHREAQRDQPDRREQLEHAVGHRDLLRLPGCPAVDVDGVTEHCDDERRDGDDTPR